MIRSFDQLRRGSDELIKGLENFNRTMQNLNDTAERVNALLNEFEEPVRAILPQVTRTVNLAEDLASRISGPVDQVVPGLTRLADTLSSPVLTSLPTDLGKFVDAINDLVRRLAPLGQLAESAAGCSACASPMPAPSPPLTGRDGRRMPTGSKAPAKNAGAEEVGGRKKVGGEEVGGEQAQAAGEADRPRRERRRSAADERRLDDRRRSAACPARRSRRRRRS